MAAFTLHISEFALEQVFEYEAYYTNISPELGEKFLEELYECLARIEGNPGLWQKVRGDIRRGIVTGFPVLNFLQPFSIRDHSPNHPPSVGKPW